MFASATPFRGGSAQMVREAVADDVLVTELIDARLTDRAAFVATIMPATRVWWSSWSPATSCAGGLCRFPVSARSRRRQSGWAIDA